MRSAVIKFGTGGSSGLSTDDFTTFIVPNLRHHGVTVTDYTHLQGVNATKHTVAAAVHSTDGKTNLEGAVNQALIDTVDQFETAYEFIVLHEWKNVDLSLRAVVDYQYRKTACGDSIRMPRGVFEICGSYQDPNAASELFPTYIALDLAARVDSATNKAEENARSVLKKIIGS